MKTVIAKKTTMLMDHGKVQLNLKEKPGDGPLVVFIHGNSHDHHTFEKQLTHPGFESYYLLSLDLPGHGESGRLDDPTLYNLPFMGRLLAELIDDYRGQREVYLVGHSFGGHVAIEVLNTLYVDKLFLFSCAPINEYSDMSDAFLENPKALGIYKENFSEEEAIDYLVECMGEEGLISMEQVKTVLLTDYRFKIELLNSLCQNNFSRQVDLLESYNGKLALYLGARDRFISLKYLQGLDLFTDLNKYLGVVDEANHDFHIVRYRQFNQILENFFKSTPLPSVSKSLMDENWIGL